MGLPPSGISSRTYDAAKTVLEGETEDVVTISDIGSVSTVELWTASETRSHSTRFYIVVDGERVWNRTVDELFLQGFAPDTQPVSLVNYAEDGENWVIVTIPYQFRSEFKVQALAVGGDQVVAAWVYVTKPR